MTARGKQLDALLAVLDGSDTDDAAINEALTILAACLRRQGRDGQRLLYLLRRDGRALVLAHSGSLVHEADPMGDEIAVIARADETGRVALEEKHRDTTAGGALAVAPGSVRGDDGYVDTDSGFRWPWSEIAPALATAVLAIPSPKPRAVLCDACKKEAYR